MGSKNFELITSNTYHTTPHLLSLFDLPHVELFLVRGRVEEQEVYLDGFKINDCGARVSSYSVQENVHMITSVLWVQKVLAQYFENFFLSQYRYINP